MVTTEDAPRRRSALARVAWWASAVSLAAVLVPVVARATGWEAGPLMVVVSLMPWVTAACAVPLVLAVMARSVTLTASAVAASALCVAWIAPLFIADGSGSEEVVLRVATVNLKVGHADAAEVVELVENEQIDLLVVQELTPASIDGLKQAGLDDDLKYSAVLSASGASGTGMWSRSPIVSSEALEGFASHTVRAEITVKGDPLAVYAVHPWPPGVRGHEQWSADYAALGELLAGEQGAVLVAGDFNATRDHAPFRRLEALGYESATDQAGAGFLPTFPEGSRLPPVVAIDHVLTRDANLVATSAQTVTIDGTDHRALVVTYAATRAT
jgi:endonuclease/exonuclease/phosphatase (EEP) superfamily protein YafD